MIEFKNVKLNLFNIDILNDISFKLPNNSITSILGYKNSGKSSILKIMSSIYKNYYGEVLCNNVDINFQNDLKIDIIHDTREKDPDISVVEYLMFYGSIKNNSTDDTKLELLIDKLLNEFSLMAYKYTNIEMLDNESYKLLELIRIRITNPDVILFDNLFSNENSDFNERLLEYVKGFIGNKTLIFATRSLNYIESILTHIIILETGNLITYGKKEDVYKKADLSNKVEIEVLDNIQDAVNILKESDMIKNLVYNDKLISFSIASNITYSEERNKIEANILKNLILKGIAVYSFKKQRVRFEQLFERLKT